MSKNTVALDRHYSTHKYSSSSDIMDQPLLFVEMLMHVQCQPQSTSPIAPGTIDHKWHEIVENKSNTSQTLLTSTLLGFSKFYF